MLKTTIVALIIALLAGAVALYGWRDHKGLAIFGGVVGIIASVVALFAAFFGALGVIFKFLPLLVIVGLAVMLVKIFLDRSKRRSTGPSSGPSSPRGGVNGDVIRHY